MLASVIHSNNQGLASRYKALVGKAICVLIPHTATMLKSMKIRKAIFTTGLICALISIFLLEINGLHNRQASNSIISKSGHYLMESIPAGGVLMPFGGMSYLRFTDMDNPSRSYRTPLFNTQYLDMRSYEDTHTVGIYWIDFSKRGQHFTISVPEWEESWLNIFVSNTPYEVIEN